MFYNIKSSHYVTIDAKENENMRYHIYNRINFYYNAGERQNTKMKGER